MSHIYQILIEAGVYVPGLPCPTSAEEALRFWWRVHRNQALAGIPTPEERHQLRRDALTLLSFLSRHPSGGLYFEPEYYRRHREECIRFIRGLQGNLKRRRSRWEIITVNTGGTFIKALRWASAVPARVPIPSAVPA